MIETPVPLWDPAHTIEQTSLIDFLAQHPAAVITTYTDIGIICLLVGLVCLVIGFAAGARTRGE